jgi:hypothetical protein
MAERCRLVIPFRFLGDSMKISVIGGVIALGVLATACKAREYNSTGDTKSITAGDRDYTGNPDQQARKALLAFNVQNNNDLLCLYSASWNKGDKYFASHVAFPNALIVTKFLQEAKKEVTNGEARRDFKEGPLVFAAAKIDQIARVDAYMTTFQGFDSIYLNGLMVLEKYPQLFSNSVRCPQLANVDQDKLKNMLSMIERKVDPEGSMTAEERLDDAAWNYCASRNDETLRNTYNPWFDRTKWDEKCVEKYKREHKYEYPAK